MMELNLDKDQLPTERALGLQWCTESDNFTLNVLPKSHQKRNIVNGLFNLQPPWLLDPLHTDSQVLAAGAL